MCGVIGIVYEKDNAALGREAGALVRHLEYRGYDSTGVATVAASGAIALRKKVGAPSRVVKELGIEAMSGQKAIGQVRWATYGSVTDTNAQPHEVRCKVHMVGAHNGNISNTDHLKEWLNANGHQVASDNDGEMLVHVIEDRFAAEGGLSPELDAERRAAVAVRAIRQANEIVHGSYAACVAFPGVPGVFAIKAGSSLYAGKGQDAAGDFVVVSSDLTSVLSKTRFLIPLSEGDGLHFTHKTWRVFSLTGEREAVPALQRSRLNVADIALQPPYQFFMEQEIAHTGANLETLGRTYFPLGWERPWFLVFERHADDARSLVFDLLKLGQAGGGASLAQAVDNLARDARLVRLAHELGPDAASGPEGFVSDESTLLEELKAAGSEAAPALRILDRLAFWKKKRRVLACKAEALKLLREARQVFLVGSGTSYHACLTGAAFLGGLAGVSAHAANPGQFRSVCLPALRTGDLVVCISQSGETKDLVDVIDDVRARDARDVKVIALVNNENSTIPQEKCDFFLPLMCGPEIAVAATKSFVSQLALMYLLALNLTRADNEVERALVDVRDQIDTTLTALGPEIEEVAQRLFLAPSMHILGTSLLGIAREGALKVREVVLNHTEGYDAAEFKHGPNTILGKHTIFSLADLERAHADGAGGGRFDAERYFSNYPLVFVCPPDPREVRITVSQIHTHKIRGADVVLIAEDDDSLRRAVEGRPDREGEYWSRYVRVPPTRDRNLFVFQAAVVLQTLALRMSIAKMAYLDRAHVRDHGVHPDVPKNVSKSITVD